MTGSRLILFTRLPEAGRTKTRLIPALGARGAAELARRMAAHAVRQMRDVGLHGILLEVRHEGGDKQAVASWLGPDLLVRPQGEGDLGERMERALRGAFDEGCGRAVLVGADVPDLTARRVLWAFAALDTRQVVLGPAEDGGYYLIGARSDAPSAGLRSLFAGTPWGTGEVLERTLHAAAAAGLSAILLDRLADVDRPEDLEVWEAAAFRSGDALVSVVVPVLNEAERLPPLLEALGQEEAAEVIVSDGGSTDGSVEICREAGVRCVSSPPGRSVQMARGCEEAVGDALVFLHADTRLPVGFTQLIRSTLSDPGVAGGAFSLAFDRGGLTVGLLAKAATWRAQKLGVVFGDQAIFVRASAMRRIGGVPQQPIMEDAEMVRRLRKAGRFVVLPDRAVTSLRGYQAGGILRTVFANQVTTWFHAAGASADSLAKLHGLLTGRRRRNTL